MGKEEDNCYLLFSANKHQEVFFKSPQHDSATTMFHYGEGVLKKLFTFRFQRRKAFSVPVFTGVI